jgi:hypothetical protein
MSDQQMRLIERAKAKFGMIYPCCGKAEWDECFTQDNGHIILWFNSKDHSTHIEKENKK